MRWGRRREQVTERELHTRVEAYEAGRRFAERRAATAIESVKAEGLAQLEQLKAELELARFKVSHMQDLCRAFGMDASYFDPEAS